MEQPQQQQQGENNNSNSQRERERERKKKITIFDIILKKKEDRRGPDGEKAIIATT